MDSKPLESINQGKNLRFINNLSKNKLYGKFTSGGKSISGYNSGEELTIRSFLKGLLSTPPKFNLNRDGFYNYTDIVDYLKEFNPKIKISESELALIKHKVKGMN